MNCVYCVAQFSINLPRQNVPKHDKIGHQTEQRVLKRSGFVFLKKEMSHPRKAVTDERNDRQKRPF